MTLFVSGMGEAPIDQFKSSNKFSGAGMSLIRGFMLCHKKQHFLSQRGTSFGPTESDDDICYSCILLTDWFNYYVNTPVLLDNAIRLKLWHTERKKHTTYDYLEQLGKCASLRHRCTHIFRHTPPPPPLSPSPVAMEPVAKAERYVVVIEVVDGGNNTMMMMMIMTVTKMTRLVKPISPRWIARSELKEANALLAFALCNVGGRSDA